MAWQRNARLVVVLVAVAVTIAVAVAYKRQPAPRGVATIAPADPTALVESTSGQTIRINREKEEIRIEYKTSVSYANAPTRVQGVKVTTVRAGDRTFVVTGNQAEVGQNETNITLEGDVQLQTCAPTQAPRRATARTGEDIPEECLDGMVARAERATYTEADAMVRAPGPIDFSRGRLAGAGQGLTYAKNVDVLTILDRAVVHMAPNAAGAGALDISAGSAEFSRLDHVIRFNGGVKVIRGGQTIDADFAVARLSANEQQVEAVELRGRASLTATEPGVGGLSAMRGQSIDLKYRADGETLERALIMGDAVARVGGERGSQDRVIGAGTLDVSTALDGLTPIALTARDNVLLTIPGETGSPARSIQAPSLDGQGEPGRGLTRARFTGGVRFRERGPEVDRSVQSGTLDVTLAPGLSEIEDARFAQNVRFEAGDLRAAAALARYALGKGTLELTGTEPALTTPQVVNDRLSVYGRRIDVALSGPTVKADGSVKSELKPRKKQASKDPETRLPSMFKDDQLVAATANELLYDGPASKAAYTGNAQLWQGDSSIRADTIVLNEKTGDLTAHGSVSTTIALAQDGKDGRKERVPSNASSDDFQYEEASRRATYLGNAHVNGPQGDMTASKVELFLKESGDELDRVEAYEALTLRDQNRETKGTRLTYVAADERYVVSGAPVSIKDECGAVTTGQRLTFDKRTDTIVIDGSQQTRTQTRGGTNCR